MINTHKLYDCIIIGGGPAGLTAGLYCARAKMDVVLLEKATLGGQIAITDLVENYPGFPEGISGKELTNKFKAQAERFGLKIYRQGVNIVENTDDNIKIIKLDNGSELKAKTVIITTGARMRTLDVPGEKEFLNRGVSYCATCDGALFEDVPIAVVGGGDSAVQEANFLTRFASKVYLIHRRDKLRAKPLLQDRLFANPKIEFIPNKVVKAIQGADFVNSLLLEDTKTGEHSTLAVDGVFIFIGMIPATDIVKDLVDIDEYGYIKVNENMETSVPGIFAAGDCRSGQTGQVVVAAGEGCIAAMSVERYLQNTE
ncbi:thioredoxin-disulfide reductase [Hydrogenobaculum acidophilum]